jgi:hypothetical protein
MKIAAQVRPIVRTPNPDVGFSPNAQPIAAAGGINNKATNHQVDRPILEFSALSFLRVVARFVL